MKSKNTSIQSLTRCLATIIKEGYTENFVMTKQGLFSDANGRYYHDNETKIISRLIFENDNYNMPVSALYIIETNDGIKGTCIKMP
jgi:hypothetical protein